MIDDKIIKDIETIQGYMRETKRFLDKIYYNPEFSTMFTKPMVSFLDHAVDFISDNLTKLKVRYIEKAGGENAG